MEHDRLCVCAAQMICPSIVAALGASDYECHLKTNGRQWELIATCVVMLLLIDVRLKSCFCKVPPL